MMTIHVSKDVEDKIEAAVRSGRYASADEMIAKLVHEDALRPPPPAEEPPLSREEWLRVFHEWINSHPARPIEIDDSRETIYAGRGE